MICQLNKQMPHDLHRRQIYYLKDRDQTCEVQKPFLMLHVLWYNIISLYTIQQP
jgi:hypothetical protein